MGAVDPVNSCGPTQSFNFRARDGSGSANIDTMTATFQTPGAAFPECQVLYTVSTGNLKLFYRIYDNYWGQWFVNFYNGQVGRPVSTMNNGACSVTSAYSSDDGLQRTLTLGMSFTAGPVYQVSRAATNLAGDTTGNVLAGTWRTQPDVTIAVTPTATTLGANGQQQFGVNISGTTNTAVTWAIASGPGTINGAGLFVAPASISSATSATVRATSNADPAKSASATIALPSNSSIAVNMLTPTGTVTAGQTYQLGASISGTSNTAVTWTVTSGSGSVGLSTGIYTAPAVVASAFTATLRATSVADPSRFATATLTVNPSPVTITMNPTSATLTGGQSAQFAATVGGTSNTSVNWSVSPASAGAVNTAGYFTAGNVTSLTSATLTATSAADPTKSASASLTIQPQSPVTLVSFAPASITGDQSVVILTGRTTTGPINLWIAVGDEFQDPYNKDAPCSFYWSGSIGGLGWTGTDPGYGSSYLSNVSCAVNLNSTTYDSATGNWTLNVTVSNYAWGNRPLKARVTSPVGSTPWTIMGYWNR